MGSPGQIEIIKVDIFNPESVKKFLENCDYSINYCGLLFQKNISFNQLHNKWPEMLAKISSELKI